MAAKKIDGTILQNMLRGAVAALETNKERVNALNVFPVPDGDTGTNMHLTLTAALKEAETVSSPLSKVALAASTGSLMGARGNSGVILSQFFRGIGSAWADLDQAGSKETAQALVEAAKTAYKAVMKPVEGTMLTVARVAAEEASMVARSGANVEAVLAAALAGARSALERTPSLLPVLREAGVVDAGGQGVVHMFEGALASFRGQDITVGAKDNGFVSIPEQPGADADSNLTYMYCTELLVKGSKLSLGKIKDKLMLMGNSLLVVGDTNAVKVHVHTNNPGRVLEELMVYGSLHDIDIDNMAEQKIHFQQSKPSAAGSKPLGVVAVVLGPGMESIFESLGVDVVVSGGQTMNPSTEELLKAIARVPAMKVVVLPNNKNVILAAEQAQEMADRQVEVIPTRSMAEGIGAMVAFNPDSDLESNIKAMNSAATRVSTGEVTYAVRTTTLNGQEILAGDIMGLINGDLKVVGKDVTQVSLDILAQMVQPENELITLFSGEETVLEEGESLQIAIKERFPHCDVELHEGGQPLYYYLMAVE
ncbi:MAG TPA: DAK2 domain-containing protein [bacterium]|nr:DAK2 domain-containing protein [bacterium]